MRRTVSALFGASIALLAASRARADEAAPGAAAATPPAAPPEPTERVVGPPPDPDVPRRVERPAPDGFLPRFVREDPRVTALPLDPDLMTFSLHGDYQLRLRALSDLRLEPPVRGGLPQTSADAPPDPSLLGQNAYLYHWLRLYGRIQLADAVSFVGQADVLRGLVAGDTTQFVGLARDPLAEDVWYDFYPRELYLEAHLPVGLVRLGQQTSHWGQGLLASDGNHRSMFGDPIRGAVVERALFATTPFGKGTPLSIALAGDLVFEDNTADLMADSPEQPDGDLAWQGVLAVMLRGDTAEIGVYGVARTQSRTLTADLAGYEERTTVGVVDVAGRFRGRVPGMSAYAYLEGEAATIFGSSSYLRGGYVQRTDPTSPIEDESILSFGAAATLGFVHVAEGEAVAERDGRYGDVVTELAWGYASGDADPFDGTTHRFTFDTNHNVGLVLFDQVLAWKTARSATIAQDPRIVGRPNPGLQFLPSQGGVFGATYVNPRVLVRPSRAVDLKLGLLVAQATADVVDPYQAGALGEYANFDGGDARRRDLGVEIDTGFDVRVPLEPTTTLELGAEGGVLFAGGAFDDAQGRGLADQFVLNTKLGLAF